MQIFERKSTTKMAYLYTLQNTIFQRTHARMRYCFIIRQLRQLNINFNQLFILALFLIVSSIVGIVFNPIPCHWGVVSPAEELLIYVV